MNNKHIFRTPLLLILFIVLSFNSQKVFAGKSVSDPSPYARSINPANQSIYYFGDTVHFHNFAQWGSSGHEYIVLGVKINGQIILLDYRHTSNSNSVSSDQHNRTLSLDFDWVIPEANSISYAMYTGGHSRVSNEITILEELSSSEWINIPIGPRDSTGPTVSISQNPTNWTNGNVSLNVTATDSSGVKNIQKPDGSLVNTSNTSYTVTANGTYTFVAKDMYNNSTTKSITVSNIDKSTPTYTSYKIYNITDNGYDVYVYGVNDTGSGVNRIQFPTWTDLNGQDDIQSNWGTNSLASGLHLGGGMWFYNVSKSSHNNEMGKYETHIYIYDNAGNYTSLATSGATLDTTAPTPPIISTRPIIQSTLRNWINSDVVVNIQHGIDYQSGVNRTEYSLYLGNSWTAWTSYTAPFMLSAENNYTIKARTVDNNNNYSTSSEIKFGIDRNGPSANISIPTTTTIRTIPVALNGITDNLSGIHSIRISNNSNFSDGTGYINIDGATSKIINFTLDKRTPDSANYSSRTVYIEIKDIAGNPTTYTKTVTLDALAPNKPVITNPINNSVRLLKEGTIIEWKYSDPNNDPIPFAQTKSELFIYDSEGNIIKDCIINGTTSSLYVNDLPSGEYTTKVTVWNSLGKLNTSNITKFKINKFLSDGSFITKAFGTSSPMRYVEVLTTSEIPDGTHLYAYIYIADKDGNYDSSKPIETEIHNINDNHYIKRLPYATNNIRIQYKFDNKTNGISNYTLTPVLDNLTVLAK